MATFADDGLGESEDGYIAWSGVDYFAGWRITLAQLIVKEGGTLTHIVGEKGYDNEVLLSRAFSGRAGMSVRAYKIHAAPDAAAR